jgi:glutamate 5-kinase
MSSTRQEVAAAQRIVVKVGTRVLTHDDGLLALARLFAIVEATAAARRGGREVILVSSGAVGLGCEKLGFERPPSDLADRQACAAVGQTRLMDLYQQGFSRLGLVTAQVLLTQGDFEHRTRYLNLRNALSSLLARGVIPVINENDVVATEELALADGRAPVFGDNDRLSALVASKLGASLLVLLTDVPGVYERDPRQDPSAQLLRRVEPETELEGAGESTSGAGRGGMRSKVEAARMAARAGCHVVIASGREPGVVEQVLAGGDVGTWFPAGQGLDARRRWIAFATATQGTLHLDAGAVGALQERGASLLAKGVTRVEGAFSAGEVVELVDPQGTPIGRGVVACDHEAARRWREGQAPAGVRNHDALVHRDLLVLEPHPNERGGAA